MCLFAHTQHNASSNVDFSNLKLSAPIHSVRIYDDMNRDREISRSLGLNVFSFLFCMNVKGRATKSNNEVEKERATKKKKRNSCSTAEQSKFQLSSAAVEESMRSSKNGQKKSSSSLFSSYVACLLSASRE